MNHTHPTHKPVKYCDVCESYTHSPKDCPYVEQMDAIKLGYHLLRTRDDGSIVETVHNPTRTTRRQ